MTTRHVNLLSLPKKHDSTHRKHSGLGIDRSGTSSEVRTARATFKEVASAQRQHSAPFVGHSSTVTTVDVASLPSASCGGYSIAAHGMAWQAQVAAGRSS